MHARWLPAASWEEAGADVRLSEHPPTWHGDDGLRQALRRLGRPSMRYTIGWNGPLPPFEGYWWDSRFANTTAVVRDVCSLLKNDLAHLFSALPSNELPRS